METDHYETMVEKLDSITASNPGESTRSRVYPAELRAENRSRRQEKPRWPEPLSDVTYCGLIGDIVHAIEPQTESDPAAILLQALLVFGSVVGRGPHVQVEGDQHHLNLYVLLVGETSKARKGTSWGRVREVFSRIPKFPRMVSGLATGEGLISSVRDPPTDVQCDRKRKRTENADVDLGVSDKRLLVVESEFARVLRQGPRTGNTLSATVRSAWDTGDLMTLTKGDPVTATGAHVSIVGHITVEELRAELTRTDSANGFANRFLFMGVRRSKHLPFGGDPLPDDVLTGLTSRLTSAVAHAQTLGAVGMTQSSRHMWATIYPKLSEGHPGLFGAATARAEAQCLRLALAFALADEASMIDARHLLAAVAVIERVEATARYIFGSALGDPLADEIHRDLRVAGPAGRTRTEISALFRRHEGAARIDAALELLLRRNLVSAHRQLGQNGRPAEIWVALSCEKSERSEKTT